MILVIGALVTACVGLPGPPPQGEDESTASSGPSPTSASSITDAMATTVDPSATSVDPDAAASSGGTGSTTSEPLGPFAFEDAPLDLYTQVDRIGFPLGNAFFNLLGDKDAYNQGTPLQDVVGQFEASFLESLETLHLGVPGMQTADNTGLDDDLATFGLVACVPPPMALDSCDDQAGPFAIPDVLTIDLDEPPGFPNGRRLSDPVVDVILAVVLLDLDVEPVTSFLDLDADGTPGPSLNPMANDVAFPSDFPYVAPRHE